MKFTELRVEGYRSLVNVTLPLHPLNVVIGPNGSGKTSLLEVFHLLGDAAQEKLAEALERLGGLNAILSKIKPKSPNRLKIQLNVDAEDQHKPGSVIYHFELVPDGTSYVVSFEQLEWGCDPVDSQPYYYIQRSHQDVRYRTRGSTGWIHPTWDFHNLELALAQVPRTYAEPEALRSALSKNRIFSLLDVSERSVIRLPQSLTPTVNPGPNGENLYSALYNLRTLHFDLYNRINDVLRIAFPGFDRLEFPVVGAGQVTMTWYQTDLSGPLYPNELSEGTLRFLWLSTVLLSPTPPPITLIDEPEVSLHPELLKLLAGLLQDAATRSQLIVATHSADLVRWLQPDEVLVLDKVDGQTQLTWADSLDLTEWLKEYTLGELWLMGSLGGRP